MTPFPRMLIPIIILFCFSPYNWMHRMFGNETNGNCFKNIPKWDVIMDTDFRYRDYESDNKYRLIT